MTGMLASVNNLEEALLVLSADVGIIDLKQPALGTLGALDICTVKQLVTAINGRCLVSATIGDLPTEPDPVFNAVKDMAETGVDYIKIGFFPDGDWQETIKKLALFTEQTQALIAVFFADTKPDFRILSLLKDVGFTGVMLDTMNKQKGSLTQLMKKNEIAEFVAQAKSRQFLCGLAGSLGLEEIPELLTHQPDYLGFRGALCEMHDRVGKLSLEAVNRIRRSVNQVSEKI